MTKSKKKKPVDDQLADRLNDLRVPVEFFNAERAALLLDCSYVLLVHDVDGGSIVVNMCHPKTGKWLL